MPQYDGGIDVRSMLVEFTDAQIEGVAMAFFQKFCDRNATNGALTKPARDSWKALALKVNSIRMLKGDA